MNRISPPELSDTELSREEWLMKAILRGKNDPISPEYRILVEKYFKNLTEGAR
jgi:hypothetical protein